MHKNIYDLHNEIRVKIEKLYPGYPVAGMQIIQAIADYNKIDKKNSRILGFRYGNDMTMVEIARVFYVCPERIRQIIEKSKVEIAKIVIGGSKMNRIVDFTYCEKCKFLNKLETDEPCVECLDEASNEDSHKPVYFEKATKYD